MKLYRFGAGSAAVLGVLALTQAVSAATTQPLPLPDPQRVEAIAAMLPERPAGLGPQIADRATWEKVGRLPGYQALLKKADKVNAEPVTPLPDSLYLMYSQNGNRSQSDGATQLSRGNLQALVMAECVRNDGRYLGKIEAYVRALCEQKSWLYSAHDAKLTTFHGTAMDVELASSMLAWNLATMDWMLGDKLSAEVRELVRDNVQRRVLTPVQERYTGKQVPWFWLTTTNNWNAVCLAGVTGAAMEMIPDRHTRALFVAGAELYSHHFMEGFPKDGYCTEGLGYWNYGFGHYAMLSQVVRMATEGKLDLMARPEARAPASFAARIQIMNGVAPAFADCAVYPHGDPELMTFVNRRFALGLAGFDKIPPDHVPTDLTEEAALRLTDINAPAQAAAPAPYTLRDFFDAAGILVARPPLNSTCEAGVALKGGNNNESHNHNDLGSYVFVLKDKYLVLDPGPERYTARTFGPHRYESKMLNSFGHDVPVVAGQLQRTGAAAQAKVIQADFTDEKDTFGLDITSAYDVPALQKLTRTWVYSRVGKGSLTITDHAVFSTPQTFATALITLGKYSQTDGSHIVVRDGERSATVTVQTDVPAVMMEEQIKEDAVVTPTRMGIALPAATADATITLTITPNE